VALIVSVLLDVCSGWCVYFDQMGFTDSFSPLAALALFPKYWHSAHLFSYGLAGAVAYYCSYDRTARISRPPGRSETIGDYSAITTVAQQIPQPPPHKRGLSPRALATLLVIGFLILFSFGLLTRCRASIRHVALRPDGQVLAVAQDELEGGLYYLDLSTGRSAKAMSQPPERMAWAPDGHHLALLSNSSGSKGSARLYLLDQVRTWVEPTLERHQREFRAVAYSADGQTLAVGCDDGQVVLWNIGEHRSRGSLTHNRSVEGLAFAPSTETLAVGLSNGQIALWDPMTQQSTRSWQAHSTEIRHLQFRADGKTLFSVGVRDEAVRAWDVKDGSEIRNYPVSMNWITDLALSSNAQTLAVSGGSFHGLGEVRLFDVSSGEVRGIFTVPTNTVSAIDFADDGQTLIAGTRPPINPIAWPRNGGLHRWDIATGQELPPLQ
jgi:WD40 repeat protein